MPSSSVLRINEPDKQLSLFWGILPSLAAGPLMFVINHTFVNPPETKSVSTFSSTFRSDSHVVLRKGVIKLFRLPYKSIVLHHPDAVTLIKVEENDKLMEKASVARCTITVTARLFSGHQWI